MSNCAGLHNLYTGTTLSQLSYSFIRAVPNNPTALVVNVPGRSCSAYEYEYIYSGQSRQPIQIHANDCR